jgi:hypothetical protein
MTGRLFGTLIFGGVLLFAMPCFSQGQDKVPTPPDDKSVPDFLCCRSHERRPNPPLVLSTETVRF